jgi:Fe2+ transport system protein FeoA
MILSSLRSGSSVIVDDCNIESKYIKRLAHMGWSNGAEVRVNTVNVPLSVALDRNSKRGRIVPDNVIIKMHQRLSEIGEVALQKPLAPEPYVMPDDGPEAILLDLDGTACIMGDRGPYDWSRVGEDSPNWPVINLANLEAMNGTLIIPFSGRDGICRDETIKWLNRYVLWEDLHMRPIGDKRKDSIVKLELFNEHIRHNYRIKYVLDDRQQVVDMWRDLGLTCLQVAKGDF